MGDAYKFKLRTFEGPLDLLLHLVRINEIEITDIPIAEIADQFLQYRPEHQPLLERLWLQSRLEYPVRPWLLGLLHHLVRPCHLALQRLLAPLHHPAGQYHQWHPDFQSLPGHPGSLVLLCCPVPH